MARISKFTILSVILISAFIYQNPAFSKESEKSTQYEKLYEELINLEPDFSKYAFVENFTFTRDAGKFTLDKGKIYLCKPLINRICAAVFIGNGKFKCTPPTKVERGQLYRFYKTESINRDFKFLFIIFADRTLADFYKALKFEKAEEERSVKSQLEYALTYLGDTDKKEIEPDIMKTMLNYESNGFFYAHFSQKKSKPFFFMFNPYAEEEITLSRRPDDDGFKHSRELICQFHKRPDYNVRENLRDKAIESIDLISFKIDVKIPKNFDFSASAEINLKFLRNRQKWFNLKIWNKMEVDSVEWVGNGGKVDYFKGDDNANIWIQCPKKFVKDNTYTLKIDYHGELLDERDDWIKIKAPYRWFPQLSWYSMKNCSYDLTFHIPEDFDLVSVGKNVSTKTEGKATTTRWVSEKPIRVATFNIGKFNSYKFSKKDMPAVTVLMTKNYPSAITNRYFMVDRAGEVVESDIVNSISFFQKIYGKSPVNEFYATETPYSGFGLAFPGIIYLPWVSFQSFEDEGLTEIFRAHEVAHQWWGISVNYKTYHDQWLSEGFSDYSGLWYMQMILKDNEKFFDVLKDYRDKIINNRKAIFKHGQEAGPIWLGSRTDTSATRGDYSLIIYKKGAWVLHMLRNMLIDLKTMNEDKFINLMRDFYSTYKNKKASTYDFQKVVEKHIGGDMEWFFKQWIYGTDTPSYTFSYKTEKTPEGYYKVFCKIKQGDVPADFQMPVPILVKFQDNKFVRLRILVKGPESVSQLPLLPLKPQKIIFNDLESVLCKVKYEKWR